MARYTAWIDIEAGGHSVPSLTELLAKHMQRLEQDDLTHDPIEIVRVSVEEDREEEG